jgi:zinc D-Ala-D-Ala carboxypeptidase
MKLSKHLELAEVIRSSTAKRLGIKNEPTAEHLANLKLLAENIFEPIREHFGRPIFISSGYRSAALNKATPGASTTSQHSKGEALDIDLNGTEISNKQVFEFIKNNLVWDQMIWEFGNKDNPDWVHVSYSSTGKQRKQILSATKVNGKTVYTNLK